MTYYAVAEAAKRLGVNPNRLKRWIAYGYYQVEDRLVVGPRVQNLFSEADLERLKEIIRKIDGGTAMALAFGKDNAQPV
jgi:hypothetical protein